jgi:hypothetical protein
MAPHPRTLRLLLRAALLALAAAVLGGAAGWGYRRRVVALAELADGATPEARGARERLERLPGGLVSEHAFVEAVRQVAEWPAGRMRERALRRAPARARWEVREFLRAYPRAHLAEEPRPLSAVSIAALRPYVRLRSRALPVPSAPAPPPAPGLTNAEVVEVNRRFRLGLDLTPDPARNLELLANEMRALGLADPFRWREVVDFLAELERRAAHATPPAAT